MSANASIFCELISKRNHGRSYVFVKANEEKTNRSHELRRYTMILRVALLFLTVATNATSVRASMTLSIEIEITFKSAIERYLTDKELALIILRIFFKKV